MKRMTLIAFLLAAVLITSSSAVTGQGVPSSMEIATVTRIVDGDTIDVVIDGTTYRVRYIGINTPESDEPCGSEATAVNTGLVMGQTVALQRDVSVTDPYDRLLYYVYAKGIFVNAALVAGGWAEAVEYPPDTAFAEWFEILETTARDSNLGCHPRGVFEHVPAQPPVAEGVTVTANNNVNLRGGPGTGYSVAGTMTAGQTMEAEARHEDWLFLGGGQWVATWVVTVTGDPTTLPDRAAPPLPAAPAPQPQQPTQPPAQQPTVPPAAVQPTVPPVPVQPTVPPAPVQPTVPPAPAFTCDCSKTCGNMASCEEAYFQLNQCGCSKRDGDGDGVPCESICPGG